ncbi:AAA family ATPase [Paenibacillus sp. FSL R5-0744]|uniref:AAA family ATPase n=1 Tax=Paenibacillus sp. FSL R5-0744 TaxID=2921656 RepID=UPI0030DA05E6
MKINKLSIDKYKNIENLVINFSDDDFAVFIGNNGSGKSNLLEAIINIFKWIYCLEKPLFDFEIDYNLFDRRNVNIKSDINKGFIVKVNNNEITLKQLKTLMKDDLQTILPRNILVYYSGHSEKLSNLIGFSTKKFIRNIKQGAFIPRHFFYLHPSYFSMVLLSILGSELEDIKILVKKNLSISSLDSFTITLCKDKADSVGFLTTFIDLLEDLNDGFEDKNRLRTYNFKGNALQKIINHGAIGYDRDLFKFLDVAHCLGVLSDIQVKCVLESGIIVGNEDFSEGEKQYLTLNAIIEFFGYKDTLYLFDEPDTFFHPNWQRQLLNDLKMTGVQTQFIITTHSPLLLSSVDQEDIFLMDNGNVFSTNSNGSLGRDVNGILTEIMGVSERPFEVTSLINKFHEHISRKKIAEAKLIIDQLKGKISDSDPFFIEAESLLHILEVLE